MADERRLTTRMLAKWSALSRDKRLPRYDDLGLDAFGKDIAHCTVIQLADDIPASRVIHVGEILRCAAWAADRQQTVLDYPANTLLHLAAVKISAVLAKRGPVTFGGTGVRDVSAILYRAILLPLSDDGEKIDHILGAINFREITAVQEYSEDGVAPPPAPLTAADRVNAYMAFASRRVAFAPSVAKKPFATVK